MELGSVAEGVAEVQGVSGSDVLIETQPELVGVLANDLRRRVNVVAIVRRWKKWQQFGRWVGHRRHVELIVHIRLIQKNIEKLVIRIVAEAPGKSFRTNLSEVALCFGERGHGRGIRFALAVAEALVISEKERLIFDDGPAKSSAELILFQRLGATGEIVGRVEDIIA